MPRADRLLTTGDVVSVDICASWRGYCADMARTYIIGAAREQVQHFVQTAQSALDAGIAQAVVGNHLSDISAAIEREVTRNGYQVVHDFAGHGIGRSMHEDPEILNYGQPGHGPVLCAGMTLAIEPMITMGGYDVFVADDGWTVKTKDKSLAAHSEDTVLVTEREPEIFTRAILNENCASLKGDV
jgi:methionyl aminopeptidase